MTDHILKMSSDIQQQQNEVKNNLIEMIKNEKFMVKSITWEDLGCGSDNNDMRVIIDCKLFDIIEIED